MAERPPAGLVEVREACKSFLESLTFIVGDTARDPGYSDRYLISFVHQDLVEVVVALPTLLEQGFLNPCRRELRFLIELAVKLAFAEQQGQGASAESKLKSYATELDSPSITIKNRIELAYLDEALRSPFLEEVGRLYGGASKFVHLSVNQLNHRKARVDAGQTVGFESEEDVAEIADLVRRTLACVAVLLLHASPPYVVGDLLVEGRAYRSLRASARP